MEIDEGGDDDDDEEEGEEEWEWSLDALKSMNDIPVHAIAPRRKMAQLIQEYHALWVRRVSPQDLTAWVFAQLNLNGGLTNGVAWDRFLQRLAVEEFRMSRLRRMLAFHKVTSGAEVEQLNDVSHVVYGLPTYMKHLNKLWAATAVSGGVRPQAVLPEEMRTADGGATEDEENIHNFTAANNTNFQNCFMHLREVLEGCNFRRADGRFFTRITTIAGFRTLAFREEMTIEQFVTMHLTHANFKAWRWATNPPGNFEQLIHYLRKRALPEAPDLNENHHMRSFEGDAQGRGSGVYDCREDFFWPYAMQRDWAQIAAFVTEARRRLFADARYQLAPPPDEDVCILHIDCVFPYDTLREYQTLVQRPVHLCWRRCARLEQSAALEWHDAPAPLVTELARRTEGGRIGDTWGESWLQTLPTVNVDGFERIPEGSIFHERLAHHGPNAHFTVDECAAVTATSYVIVRGMLWVPMLTPERERLAIFTAEEWEAWSRDACRPHVRVTDPTLGVCFCPYLGRTWDECAVPEIDQIYTYQRFGVSDRFMLYACKGRLFFDVGECDNYEFTLMLEGRGGCGKSTVMKAQQAFWPPHLRGILSPNVQPQFGMSAVLRDNKTRVIFCNEVGDSCQIVQEEWQTNVSNEYGSYAVKNSQDPLVCRAKAQHFWIGNKGPIGPKGFNNDQGQVSRRLAAVYMPFGVQARDGGILKRILTLRMGELCRKETLAYWTMVKQQGKTDPMSEPDRLPPAFADQYRRTIRISQPLVEFFDSGAYVVCEEDAQMSYDEFRDLYDSYRLDNNLPKALRTTRGDEELRGPFADRGITINHVPSGVPGRTTRALYGVRAA